VEVVCHKRKTPGLTLPILIKQDLSEPTPGPGAYTLPKFKTPAATMSGRNKFGSPW